MPVQKFTLKSLFFPTPVAREGWGGVGGQETYILRGPSQWTAPYSKMLAWITCGHRWFL